MKRIVWIVIIIAALAGCNEKRHPLLKEAADIIHQRPDSALALISRVDTASLSETERMEYCLLKVMTDYIVLHHADGDSLVSACVDYYDKHGDAWHRGRAYYYRGGIRRNYNCFNHLLILEYSQKYLESSRRMNDSVMTLRGLQFCASAYANMDQSDSAYAYIFRSMDYIDLADSILRAHIYLNIAAMYEERGDVENARKYLEKWRNDKEASNFKGYETMARLLEAQGHYQEAIEAAKKCLTEKDPLVRNHSMDVLSRLYEKTGDMSAALDMKRQKDAFTDSVMKANHSLQIADWQRKFDEERWEKRSQQRMKETGAVIAVAFVVLVFGIWWRQRRRVHQLVFRLDENARRITENQTEIERLQQGDEASEQTIANLRRQIEDSRQRIASKLLTGTQQFVKLQQKECVGDMTAEERQCLIDYFAQLRPKRWQQWEHTYHPLTPAQYVFLILQDDLRYNDDTIAQILDVKPASLRTTRSRIKGRER